MGNPKQPGKCTAARRTAMESPQRGGLRVAGLGMEGLTRRKEGRAQNITSGSAMNVYLSNVTVTADTSSYAMFEGCRNAIHASNSTLRVSGVKMTGNTAHAMESGIHTFSTRHGLRHNRIQTSRTGIDRLSLSKPAVCRGRAPKHTGHVSAAGCHAF